MKQCVDRFPVSAFNVIHVVHKSATGSTPCDTPITLNPNTTSQPFFRLNWMDLSWTTSSCAGQTIRRVKTAANAMTQTVNRPPSKPNKPNHSECPQKHQNNSPTGSSHPQAPSSPCTPTVNDNAATVSDIPLFNNEKSFDGYWAASPDTPPGWLTTLIAQGPVALSALLREYQGMLGSGSSKHLFNDRRLFWNFDANAVLSMGTANCGSLQTHGKGMKMRVQDLCSLKESFMVILNDAHYAPDCLVSLS
ncbi:hypothetical protein PM082_018411 [Marasmius tenuissimus]|nr:hypothetical protein PM082_018411 [Marasmius tenuissimus]